MPGKQTIYPFVVSMTGAEWDAIINNLNGSEQMPDSMLDQLLKKSLVVLNEASKPRLYDPVAECVRFVSLAKAVAAVECPSAVENSSAINIFFLGDRHMVATRQLDGSRVDFMLSEADETPLELLMILAQEVTAPGECREEFLPDEKLPPELLGQNIPLFRVTLQLENVPNSQKVFALMPRNGGGCWLFRSTSLGARQGSSTAMLAKLRSYLTPELEQIRKC